MEALAFCTSLFPTVFPPFFFTQLQYIRSELQKIIHSEPQVTKGIRWLKTQDLTAYFSNSSLRWLISKSMISAVPLPPRWLPFCFHSQQLASSLNGITKSFSCPVCGYWETKGSKRNTPTESQEQRSTTVKYQQSQGSWTCIKVMLRGWEMPILPSLLLALLLALKHLFSPTEFHWQQHPSLRVLKLKLFVQVCW